MTLAHEPVHCTAAQARLLHAFAAIKRGSQPFTLTLPDGAGQLVPVTERHDGDAALLAEFSRWRDENAFAFPTQFAVTLDGTSRWLRKGLLDVPDRLLFLVQAADETFVGHLGFANCSEVAGVLEIDNVVRGVKHGAPGIMAAAMQRLTDWAQRDFSPREVFLRVFADNTHAVRFYERCGYVFDTLLPLRRSEDAGRITFATPAAADTRPADAHFARMILQPRHLGA